MRIPFNKPFITGKEVHYIYDAVATGKISGNGKYTNLCQNYFQERYGFKKVLLTTSCTDALEMCALLLDIQPGDEVIVPSYTFVSTALAFVRQGAKVVFADSHPDHPRMDETKIEALITKKTKAIVPVHYAGVACNMEAIVNIANRNNIYVVEDAAQAIDAYYISSHADLLNKYKSNVDHNPKKEQESEHRQTQTDSISKKQRQYKFPLGSIGHLACFSFHETKNIQCGEGGMLVINDDQLMGRAEVIWEKGTNRADFFQRKVDKYEWVDLGSSFLPSEITAAFLWAQIEALDVIQKKRFDLWTGYMAKLKEWASQNEIQLPVIPDFSTNNAHLFYLVCPTKIVRDELILRLRTSLISSVFHYQSLHQSSYYKERHDGRKLTQSDRYSWCLMRLPMFQELNMQTVSIICNKLINEYPY